MPKRFYPSFRPHPSPLIYALRDYRQQSGPWQVFLYHYLWYDWSWQNQTNWCDWERIGTILFLASFLVAALYCKGAGKQNSKFQETSFTLSLFFITVLLYEKSHFRQTSRLYFLAPRRVARSSILLSVFVIKFYPILVRCLKDTSWKVVTYQITYLLQSHLKFPHECYRNVSGQKW